MTRPTPADLFGQPTITSMILDAAGNNPAADVHEAWCRLIERYRDPVEKCLRSKLRGRPDLEADATAFFAYLFELKVLPKYERRKGSFRQYVQGVIARYARALRRPGTSSAGELIDENTSAAPSALELEMEEEAFWAEAVLKRALQRLEKERPRDTLILVKAFGIASHASQSRESLGAEFDLKSNAVNVAVFRAKGRLRELVMEEVRDLSPDPSVFEQEHELLLERLLEAHPSLATP